MRTSDEFIEKHACKQCSSLKRKEILHYKKANKLINDPFKRGYWSIKENIEFELINYIKKYSKDFNNRKRQRFR